MAETRRLRSFLYAPGSSSRILGTVLDAGADAVVLDLEDSVPATKKAEARAAVAALISERASTAQCDIHVRVNGSKSGYTMDDLKAVVLPGLGALRLPKCEAPEDVVAIAEQIREVETAIGIVGGTVRLYPTVETAAGLDRAREIAEASSRVAALVFGPSDFAADLRIDGDSRDATLLARSTLVLESRLAGVGPPIDGAYTALSDLVGLRRMASWVRSLGFGGKSAIHPVQLPVLHEVFTPTDHEIARATRIVNSLDETHATAVVEGRFVDPAVVAQASALLESIRVPLHDQNDGA